MFKRIRWYWHLSRLEKMIMNHEDVTKAKKFEYHLRKFQRLQRYQIIKKGP